MSKQIGINGIIDCPECGFKAQIKDYHKKEEGESFGWRCSICGKVFELNWRSEDVIFVMEEK